MSSLGDLLVPPAAWPDEGVEAWWSRAAPLTAGTEPREMAIALGSRADRLAYAFAGGYLAALRALVPADSDSAQAKPSMSALCATETGGTRPSAIETVFVNGRLTGDKTFVTLAHHADVLFVLAKEGERADGRPRLALVRVDARAPDVRLTPLPELPFVPEIGHASVRFDGVPGQRLEGDGWDAYVRPFRTVEDVHVHLAFVAWQLAGLRRRGGRASTFERGLVILSALRDVALADPSEPSTHLVTAGAIAATEAWVQTVDWSLAPVAARERWERDRRLLRVASKARESRRVRAWERAVREAGVERPSR